MPCEQLVEVILTEEEEETEVESSVTSVAETTAAIPFANIEPNSYACFAYGLLCLSTSN